MEEKTTVYFLSNNENKIREVRTILCGVKSIEIKGYSEKIDEIQSVDIEKIVRDKALKAFKKIGRPVLVDHTGLIIPCFGSFPGGLTQIFWDSLKADSFCEFFRHKEIFAISLFAYCDGKRIHIFRGEIAGTVSETPKGNREFQWDCIFVPNGYNLTFAEMGGQKKNSISMRKKALDSFLNYWEQKDENY